VDSDGASAELVAVQDDVVGLGPDAGEVGFEKGDVLVERSRERMMHGDVPLFLFAPLEHREVRDPGEGEHLFPAAFGGDELLADLAQDFQGGVRLVGDHEHQVVRFGAGGFPEGVRRGLGELERGFQSARPLGPEKARGAERLGPFSELVDLAPRIPAGSLDGQAFEGFPGAEGILDNVRSQTRADVR